MRDTAAYMGVSMDIPRDAVVAYDDYVGPGYSLPTDAMVEAVKLLARTESILLDPVYSGKAMSGLMDLVRKDHFKKGALRLACHGRRDHPGCEKGDSRPNQRNPQPPEPGAFPLLSGQQRRSSRKQQNGSGRASIAAVDRTQVVPLHLRNGKGHQYRKKQHQAPKQDRAAPGALPTASGCPAGA